MLDALAVAMAPVQSRGSSIDEASNVATRISTTLVLSSIDKVSYEDHRVACRYLADNLAINIVPEVRRGNYNPNLT